LCLVAGAPFAVEPDSVPDIELRTVVSAGLSGITSITHAGDERIFVTEAEGRIRIIENDALVATPFLDINGLVSTAAGEHGLFSVAFHPDYDSNGFFFVNYTDNSGDTVVARYEVSAGDPDLADSGSAEILLNIDQPASNHNGGQLQFGPDGYLYIGMGDGGGVGDPSCNAQDPETLLGKMLRIDVDQNVNTAPFYGIPGDNPFGGAGEPEDEVWATGLRNPWRFSFDRVTGDLYIADVGQDTREEVNFQPADSAGGENYGWKIMEGSLCFSTSNCDAGTPACNDPSLTLPVLEYDQDVPGTDNCSITGGYVYRGHRIAGLVGRYLYGDLCSGRLWAGWRFGDAWQSVLLAPAIGGLRTFGEDLHGNVYAASSGTVFELVEPASVFFDGFESGDTSAWSTPTPVP
jgi:hypothetical protein